MRRIAVMVTVALAAIAVSIALLGSPARGASTYRVDVIFDTAKGIIPGQLVKIAGARVGKVEGVKLTPNYKARIQMSLPRRFAPFRVSASCSIQPEGLVGENFVQCDPGRSSAPPLTGRNGQPPTVPVSHTSVPVNLTDLFNIFNTPVRQRFSIVVAELGIGLDGRGEDFNAILRRANPALADARRALSKLNAQRDQIAATVSDSDRLVAELARRRGAVRSFVSRAALVTSRTAAHRRQLAVGIRRLPALLRATRPALRDLDTFTRDGAPLLAQLRTAAPDVNRLVADIPPFAQAGVPALQHLSTAAVEGRKTVRNATPIVGKLREFASDALPTGKLVNQLFVNLRERGVVEGLLAFVYQTTATTARYDQISHILPAHLVFVNCGFYATTPQPGCSANFHGGAGSSTSSTAASARPGSKGSVLDANGALAQRVADSIGLDAKRERRLQDLADYLLGP